VTFLFRNHRYIKNCGQGKELHGRVAILASYSDNALRESGLAGRQTAEDHQRKILMGKC